MPTLHPHFSSPDIGAIAWELLVFSTLLAPLLFYIAAIIALYQLIKHRAWNTWSAVAAGPTLALGAAFRQGLWFLDPVSRPSAPIVLIEYVCLSPSRPAHPALTHFPSIGSLLLTHAAFLAFARLARWMLPASNNGESRALTRFVRAGYALLSLSGLVTLVFFFSPQSRALAPVLTLPFCAYFVWLVRKYDALSVEWALRENQSLSFAVRRPWRVMLEAVRWVAVALTVRAALGVVVAAVGWFHNSLVFHVVADDVILLYCYVKFERNHPGWFLPPELTGLILNRALKAADDPVAL